MDLLNIVISSNESLIWVLMLKLKLILRRVYVKTTLLRRNEWVRFLRNRVSLLDCHQGVLRWRRTIWVLILERWYYLNRKVNLSLWKGVWSIVVRVEEPVQVSWDILLISLQLRIVIMRNVYTLKSIKRGKENRKGRTENWRR